MKKNITLTIIGMLIIVILSLLGWTIYDSYYLENELDAKIYPMKSYELDLPGFNLINYKMSEDKIYLLYENNGYYINKEIDILNNKTNSYSYEPSGKCHLQMENNYPYISCLDEKSIYVYKMDFSLLFKENINSINSYTIYTDNNFNIYEDVDKLLYSTCNSNCYLVKYSDIIEIISIYKDSELLETNVTNYSYYENGVYTYNNTKLKIYNATNNEYKEFSSPINLNDSIFSLGNNSYYLYILKNNKINIYNLYDGSNFSSIDIYKVKEKVLNIHISNGNLYIFTNDILYVYDISEIETNNLNTALDYEDALINNKVKYFKENYLVNINVFQNPTYLNSNYNITPVNNYNDVIDSLNALEDYFLLYNKEFFQRFYEYGMNGLDIYFAYDIVGITNGYADTDVVGLYFKKDNKYIMIFKLNSDEQIRKIASHETMHAIEDYLKNKDETFSSWNNYNPKDFEYSHVYYVNELYNDTLNNNKNNQDIYFVDNYARSSASEDRARLFEYICTGENFSNYPHLNAKVNYLKSVLLNNFPELYYISYFNR